MSQEREEIRGYREGLHSCFPAIKTQRLVLEIEIPAIITRLVLEPREMGEVSKNFMAELPTVHGNTKERSSSLGGAVGGGTSSAGINLGPRTADGRSRWNNRQKRAERGRICGDEALGRAAGRRV